MKTKRRTKQDQVNEGGFLFGEPTTFEKAFPEIKNISIEFNQRGYGVYNEESKRRITDSRDIGEYLNCNNSSCQRGGFAIGQEIREMVRSKETEREKLLICEGDEGSPKGRKIGRRCINHINVKIKIKYKKPQNE